MPTIDQKKMIIGIDEAGYGPRLGPLVVGGSSWLAPLDMSEQQLTDKLAGRFRASPWRRECDYVPLGDSKILYQSGKGLETLESGLIAISLLTGSLATDLAAYINQMEASGQFFERSLKFLLPWYQNLQQFSVPVRELLDKVELGRLSDIACATLNDHRMKLLAIRSTIIEEPEFNRQIDALGSKGSLLSLTSLDLAGHLWDLDKAREDIASVEIYCDRQGGRKNYLPLLMHWMPDAWFTETQRSSQRCSYRSTSGRSIQVHFSVGGDRFPPTALASMAAKYLRERLMQSFNQFWAQQVAGLRPTAGYPTDALRFRAEIEQAAQRFSLDSRLWWRMR